MHRGRAALRRQHGHQARPHGLSRLRQVLALRRHHRIDADRGRARSQATDQRLRTGARGANHRLAHRAEHPRGHGRDRRRLPGPGPTGGRHGAARGVPRVLTDPAPGASERAPRGRRAMGAAAGRASPGPAAPGARRAERPVRVTSPPPGSSWFGHPRGLSTLFFTEMWERFRYYGMRGFLILYMTKALGFTDPHAGAVYGNYVGSVWLAAIFGGIIADRWLGHYRSVLIGGIIIALGHFTLAFHALPFFYSGLSLIVIGTGLLKPNVSTLVGSLYDRGDERRDAGFSIFYMGINLGAFLGPLIAGKLAEGVDWHLGFACAGVGMLLGLTQYVLGRRRLQPAVERIAAQKAARKAVDPTGARGPLSSEDWRRIWAVVVLFIFASLFWGAYEQAGSTLTLFADRYVHLELLGIRLYASWFVSVQAAFVILLSPLFAWLWVRLGPRQPSSPAKFALALVLVGLAFVLLIPAGSLAQGGVKVSPLWLIGAYFIQELGELCLSPVGLSLVTKVAPVRLVSVVMGIFFLSNFLGNLLAGWSARFVSTVPLVTLFSVTAAVTLGAGLILFFLLRPIRSLMGGVR